MKITIAGSPKEIAALALKTQGRHDSLSREDTQELVNVMIKRAMGEKVRGSKF